MEGYVVDEGLVAEGLRLATSPCLLLFSWRQGSIKGLEVWSQLECIRGKGGEAFVLGVVVETSENELVLNPTRRPAST